MDRDLLSKWFLHQPRVMGVRRLLLPECTSHRRGVHRLFGHQVGLHLSEAHLHELPMLASGLSYFGIVAPLAVLFALTRTQGG